MERNGIKIISETILLPQDMERKQMEQPQLHWEILPLLRVPLPQLWELTPSLRVRLRPQWDTSQMLRLIFQPQWDTSQMLRLTIRPSWELTQKQNRPTR